MQRGTCLAHRDDFGDVVNAPGQDVQAVQVEPIDATAVEPHPGIRGEALWRPARAQHCLQFDREQQSHVSSQVSQVQELLERRYVKNSIDSVYRLEGIQCRSFIAYIFNASLTIRAIYMRIILYVCYRSVLTPQEC